MKSSPFKTQIPENLKSLSEVPFCTYRKYRPSYPEVDPLLLLCELIVDCKWEPKFWKLTADEVAELVSTKWNHPELKEAFIVNNIDGPALVFLEADRLPKMNIRIFDVIKELTAEIRKLCKLDMDEFNRSISLPFRRPHVLFLWYKARRTGPTSYFMTPSNYFRKINIIRDETTEDRRYYALLNHWNRIPPFRLWCPHVMIGARRRINPMTGTTMRQNFHPRKIPVDHPHWLRNLCLYHLPCPDTEEADPWQKE